MTKNDRSASESLGTYSIASNPYSRADVTILANCEGFNTADPQISASSTVPH
jgi:hypothetical protein